MAFARVTGSAAHGGSDATTASTPSISITAGSTLLVAFLSSTTTGSAETGDPVISQSGFTGTPTFDLSTTPAYVDGSYLRVWVVSGLSGTGTFTVTAGGTDSWTFYSIVAYEDTTGLDVSPVHVISTQESTNSAPNTVTTTLGWTADTADRLVLIAACRGGAYDATAKAGWTDTDRYTVVAKSDMELHQITGSAETTAETTWNNGSTIIYTFHWVLEFAPAGAGATSIGDTLLSYSFASTVDSLTVYIHKISELLTSWSMEGSSALPAALHAIFDFSYDVAVTSKTLIQTVASTTLSWGAAIVSAVASGVPASASGTVALVQKGASYVRKGVGYIYKYTSNKITGKDGDYTKKYK
jgi:hypothetical protein